MQKLPIVYVRGYAGPTAGINTQVDDPFYGFNEGRRRRPHGRAWRPR